MPTYVVHNTHGPDECQALMEEIYKSPWSKTITGTEFYCGCPHGTHESVVAVDAKDPEEALGFFDKKFRAGATAFEVMHGAIGQHEMLPVA
jgi:hypothetical protein